MQRLQKWCIQPSITGSLKRSQHMAQVRSSLRFITLLLDAMASLCPLVSLTLHTQICRKSHKNITHHVSGLSKGRLTTQHSFLSIVIRRSQETSLEGTSENDGNVFLIIRLVGASAKLHSPFTVMRKTLLGHLLRYQLQTI